jgi:hypothetical protein
MIAALVEPEVAHDAREHRALVAVVVNHEVPFERDLLGVTPQQPRTDRVKRADPQGGGTLGEKRREPLAHLRGGLVRESDGQNAPGRHAPFGHQVSHAVRDHARFAAAGARKHHQRPLAMQYRFALAIVEPCDQ